MTYYEILEVTETASQEVIHMAYKALCKKYHPDIYEGDKTFAEEQMKKINNAYAILSDSAKRKEYDDFLKYQKQKTQNTYSNNTQTNTPPKKENTKKEPKTPRFPSGTRSGVIITLWAIASFCSVSHIYIENPDLFDLPFLLGLFDFAFLNLIMLVVPLLVYAIKGNHTIKSVKQLCLFNGIGVWVVSLILYVCEMTITMNGGWLIAVMHYFINKHILLQLVKKDYSQKKRVVITTITIGALSLLVVVGMLFTNGVYKDMFAKNNNLIDNKTDAPDYIAVDGKVYPYNDSELIDYDWDEIYEEEYERRIKSNFLDEYIVFVIDGFGDYYYTYDEMWYVTKEMDEYTYWAYNKEAAIAYGYVPSNINVSYGWSTEKAFFLEENIVFVIDGFGNFYYTYDEMINATQEMTEYTYWAYNINAAIGLGYKHH